MKSNAILFARDGQTVGVGAGQMSRVDSVKIAVIKAGTAGLNLAGSVVASDAFFPFPDGVEEAGKAGATAVIQPGGSVRDQDVIAAANKLGMAMVFTGVRPSATNCLPVVGDFDDLRVALIRNDFRAGNISIGADAA